MSGPPDCGRTCDFDDEAHALFLDAGDTGLPLAVPPIEDEHPAANLHAHDIDEVVGRVRTEADIRAGLQRAL